MVYRTITQAGEHEIIIKKSRFICQLQPVTTEAEAQAFIAAVKKKHYKATHNVPAYLLGDDDLIQRASDDGEPSGTSGVPTLQALQEMGLHDVAAVTTRYFGGIKLGAGGLMRAYRQSVSAAVHELGVVKRVTNRALTIRLDYAQLAKVQHFLEQQAQPIAATDYTEAVTLKLFVPVDQVAGIQKSLTDLVSGQAEITEGALQNVLVPTPVD